MTPEQLTGQEQGHLHQLYPNHWVHLDAIDAIQGLQKAAAKAGFDLRLASSFRSFERQKAIWNAKFQGKQAVYNQTQQPQNLAKLNELEKVHAIALYSAPPGLSRHHWGCDFDIFDINKIPRDKLQLQASEYQQGGPCFELSLWLSDNMNKFDFFLPYKTFTGGVAIEPWHISYIPVAQEAQSSLSESLLRQQWLNQGIEGENSLSLHAGEIISRYVSNICYE